MKIFKSASIVLALLLFLGVNVEASSPKVIVSETGQVQVTNLGNDIVGIELCLQLSNGSFNSNAFVPVENSSYTFEKVSGNTITIYSTSQSDLASDGTLVLGSIKTTNDVAFTNGTTLNIIDGSLSQLVYANVELKNDLTVENTGGTSTGTMTNTTGNTTNTTEGTTSDDESDVETEDDLEEYLELYESNPGEAEEYLSNNGATSAQKQEKFGGSLYIWLLLLIIILLGVGAVLYANKPEDKNKKSSDNEKQNKETSNEK